MFGSGRSDFGNISLQRTDNDIIVSCDIIKILKKGRVGRVVTVSYLNQGSVKNVEYLKRLLS